MKARYFLAQWSNRPAFVAKTVMAKQKSPSTDPSLAPGILLGFGLQITHLTAMLIKAPPGSICSVEVLDDVAQQSSDGTLITQTKSALSSNPVADHALGLWKTLATWARLSSQGKVDPQTTQFHLYVSRAVGGDIVNKFSAATNDAAAEAALSEAKILVLGGAEKADGPANLSATVREQATHFFDSEHVILQAIVSNFILICGSGSPHDDLVSLVRQGPVSPSKAQEIASHLCGWVKVKAERLLEQGEPAVLSKDEFHAEYISQCHRVDRQTILTSATLGPPKEVASRAIEDQRTFIKQLLLIELDFDQLLAAASDFLRAGADRTAWAMSGDVHADSLDDLDEALTRTFGNERSRCAILHRSLRDEEHGRLLYSACSSFQTRVQGMEVPPHFIPGCFHLLAEELAVGWHPSFERLIAATEGKLV